MYIFVLLAYVLVLATTHIKELQFLLLWTEDPVICF
jgi:hypothetical protein